jgi:hypothetical protein
MAALVQHKTVGAPFSNDEEIVRVRYNFADDGGATTALDVITADGDILITSWHAVVKTTFQTADSATLAAGITGTAGYFIGATAAGSLTENAVLRPLLTEGTPNAEKLPVRLASGSKVIQTVGTGTFTAGAVEHVIKYVKI